MLDIGDDCNDKHHCGWNGVKSFLKTRLYEGDLIEKCNSYQINPDVGGSWEAVGIILLIGGALVIARVLYVFHKKK